MWAKCSEYSQIVPDHGLALSQLGVVRSQVGVNSDQFSVIANVHFCILHVVYQT